MSNKKILKLSLVIAVLILLGFGYWLSWRSNWFSPQEVVKNPQEIVEVPQEAAKNSQETVESPQEVVKRCGDGICNNGERSIDCPSDCNKYFPNFDLSSWEFDQLMADIEVSRTPVKNKTEILARLQKILRWLAEHRAEGDLQDECMAYMKRIKDYDGWESPEVWGKVYQQYSFVCPGTCFSTSHTFTLLAYKAGILEEDFQMIGRGITKNNKNQHWWTRVKIEGDKWLEIDPLCAKPDTVLSAKENLLCNREELYHPCRSITVSEERNINTSSWHCVE